MKKQQFSAFSKIIKEFKKLPAERVKHCNVSVGLYSLVAYQFTLETFNIKLIDEDYAIINGHEPQSILDEQLYPNGLVIQQNRIGWLYIEEERIAKKENKEFVY
jgi:hypothetical protein